MRQCSFSYILIFWKKSSIDFLDFEEDISYRNQRLKHSYWFQESKSTCRKALHRGTSRKVDVRIIQNGDIPYIYPFNLLLNVFVCLESCHASFKNQKGQCKDVKDKGTFLLVTSYSNFNKLGILRIWEFLLQKRMQLWAIWFDDFKRSSCRSSI